MNVDYAALEEKILDGSFRAELEAELTVGFRTIRMSGERLPLASHYAAQIAEIVNNAADRPIGPELAFELYQEILAAVERARVTVMGEPPPPPNA